MPLLKMPGEEEPGSTAARTDPAPDQVGSEGRRGSVGGAGHRLALSLRLQPRVQRVDDFPGSGAGGCGGVFAAALIPQPKTAERADNGCGGEEPSQGRSRIPTSLCLVVVVARCSLTVSPWEHAAPQGQQQGLPCTCRSPLNQGTPLQQHPRQPHARQPGSIPVIPCRAGTKPSGHWRHSRAPNLLSAGRATPSPAALEHGSKLTSS